MIPYMVPYRASFLAFCAASAAFIALPIGAQTAAERTALSRTVSIGDVMRAEDQKAVVAKSRQVTVSSSGTATAVVKTNALPIHIIYVHGINEVGADDSKMLRDSICRYLHECVLDESPRVYADGPFALSSQAPKLTYLGQPIWASDEEWHASAPFSKRYRMSGNGHAPIVLDELNWYPLAYPLKCKFLLPGDAKLSGGTKSKDEVCLPQKNEPDGTGHFLAYRWPPNGPLFNLDLPQQHGTLINSGLKVGLLDWGFGDAAMALGPMEEILTAAIRQLFVQSLANLIVDPAGAPMTGDTSQISTFFVTHSLGSYLSLAAMDAAWLGSETPELKDFQVTGGQQHAADDLASHTSGFYFLANQIALLELGRVAQQAQQSTMNSGNCSVPVTGTGRATPVPANVAVSHYGCMRQRYLDTHPTAGPAGKGPQIIAWSAADDLLSWYVPAVPGVKVVNLKAHNSAFHIPKVVAWPTSVHDNYAKNKSVVRGIFGVTKP